MKRYFDGIMILMAAGACLGEVKDSSDLIFNDNVVNDFHISFYFPGWLDSLENNKNNDETYIPARFTWYGPDGDSILLDSVGVRYKGNSSYVFAGNSPKKPFKFYFNKYRKDQLFFSLEKLNFSNGIKDPTMMREKIAYDVLGKYMPAPRAVFATLTVGDSLVKALYTQVEQVDELFLKRHFDSDKYNLYKAGDQGATLAYKTANQRDYEDDYELKTNERENDWRGLIVMLDEMNNTPDADFVKVVGALLDLDNCIRYLAFNMVNANFDSYTGSGRNFYLYDDGKAGKFKLIPWDLNLSFAAFPYNWDKNIISVDAFAPSNLNDRPLEKRILSNDSLKRVYAGYMKKMIAGPLSADSVGALAYRLKAVIDSSVIADTNKFFPYDQFATNIDTELVIKKGIEVEITPGLKSFTMKRNAYLLAQIEKILPVIKPPTERISGRLPMLQCVTGTAGKLTVAYWIPASGVAVGMKIYNLKGELVRSVFKGIKNRGFYSTELETQTLPSGYYAIILSYYLPVFPSEIHLVLL